MTNQTLTTYQHLEKFLGEAYEFYNSIGMDEILSEERRIAAEEKVKQLAAFLETIDPDSLTTEEMDLIDEIDRWWDQVSERLGDEDPNFSGGYFIRNFLNSGNTKRVFDKVTKYLASLEEDEAKQGTHPDALTIE